MSLPAPDVHGLLRRYGLRPDKRLGQNFLIDPAALSQVVEAAKITANDIVLEIGPGLGSLTHLLAAQARKVIAVELDANLISPLQEVISGLPNVQVVQGDMLNLNPSELLAESIIDSAPSTPGYLVVANIPYYITSPLMRHLLEADFQPRRLVLTVQREVALRICAAPGDLSLLALSVQVYGLPHIEAYIPSAAFFPSPQVDSAVVRVDIYTSPLIPTDLLPGFFRLVRAGFSQKRKNLRNSLSAGMHWTPAETVTLLEAAGIAPSLRAEKLSMDEWKTLVEKTRQLHLTIK